MSTDTVFKILKPVIENTTAEVVWGTAALEDMDPALGVVEVHLTASETELLWTDDADDITEDVWACNGVVPGPLIQA